MGGKSKQARVKNNAKPSSSSRSAELLGNATNAFVGFTAHSEHGLIPVVPGFSDSLLDSLDANKDPQLQLILRKMSKKDPVTKVKALKELSELLNTYDVSSVKGILPLWPKIYHTLSNDVDHRVRECSQEIMNIIAFKCKKALTPFLKNLVPIWLSSNFDDYAPAASIASSGLRTTFSNKISAVCNFCQIEIVEYVVQNLSLHNASNATKNCTPEEADQKYQRIVRCSLRMLSYFLAETGDGDIEKVHHSIQDLLAKPKFWSFAKSKDPKVKASWFEVLHNMLLKTGLRSAISASKIQIITTSFQNLDESEPLVLPHVWSCILLTQTIFDDWYNTVNFKKALIPKLSKLLRNDCNKNADVICPNLLPFLSKISQESLNDIRLYDFHKSFLDNMKTALIAVESNAKSVNAAMYAAYFECLRYIMQKINISIQDEDTGVDKEALKIEAIKLFNENFIELLISSLRKETFIAKFAVLHTSTLIVAWANTEKKSELYKELLNIFWKDLALFTNTILMDTAEDDVFLNNIIALIDKLYLANPKSEEQKVTFDLLEDDMNCKDSSSADSQQRNDEIIANNITSQMIKSIMQAHSDTYKKRSAIYIESDLRNLVVQIACLCLDKCNQNSASNYICIIRKLTYMFNDIDFYAKLSKEKTIKDTLHVFINLSNNIKECGYVEAVDIIFEILHFLPKEEKFNFIENNMLQLSHSAVQNSVMNRLLSYPLVIEPEVLRILSLPRASAILLDVANAVLNNSKDAFNLLRKCFFPNERGVIPIDRITAEEIVKILLKPMATNNSEHKQQMDACGSFIAQIMPVICNEGNTSPEIQRYVFLKLFKFSIEHVSDAETISEDTIWEISTCWQDALSSQDVRADRSLFLECKTIIEDYLRKDNLGIEAIDSMANSIASFILCSIEVIEDKDQRSLKLDETIEELFNAGNSNLNRSVQNIQEFCLFLEALLGNISLGGEHIHSESIENTHMTMTFRQILLNSLIIYKLVGKPAVMQRSLTGEHENENQENTNIYKNSKQTQWPKTLYHETLRCIKMASIGDSIMNNISQIEPELKTVLTQLSEKIKTLLRKAHETFIANVKDFMLDEASKEVSISATRALLYLVYINDYSQFEENATILLFEFLSEYFTSKNSLKAYVNALQFLLPHLLPKVITTQMPIMRSNPDENWIRAAVFRCLVQNNFSSDYNEKSDRSIIDHTLQFLQEMADLQRSNAELFVYNVEINKQPIKNVLDTIELINILKEAIIKFPHELKMRNWDAIRIGLSSWVLSISKSGVQHIKIPQVALLTAKVFELYAVLANFFRTEKQKSSKEFMQNIIDEWENLFSREVNIVLFKVYYNLVEYQESASAFSKCYNKLLEVITPAMEFIDYGIIFNFSKASPQINSDDVLNFLLKNLSNSCYCVQRMSVNIIKQLTPYYVTIDTEAYETKLESINVNATASGGDWHFLNKLQIYIECYEKTVSEYLTEFSFKITEIADLKLIQRKDGLTYLFLWDCIIYICANSPITLRFLYTSWLKEKRHEEYFLLFLFRAMPAEILKNYDCKLLVTDAFKSLTWNQIQDRNLALEKYACHLYTEVLRKLPAFVRKWWNTCPSRQKAFIDKLTTNFVSPIICNEELKALAQKNGKHENMQVTVHTSTRDVLAVYSIDEARMALIITLAPNYPLGSVKVLSGKQIGGRLSARNTGMQLTLFLTHQNGSIFDGLTLWKNNLDKKFAGVEECYICYTVIHQDTYQLPKLSCKICKKKFHGSCLYKWFTTSSKSTCPICRNVF